MRRRELLGTSGFRPGLRRAELAGICLDDLDLEGQVVRVVGKGRRVRTVPFGKKAAAAIDRYLRVRPSHRDADRREVWLGSAARLRQTASRAWQALKGGRGSAAGRSAGAAIRRESTA